MKRLFILLLLIVTFISSLGFADSGDSLVWDIREQIPSDRITLDVERQIRDRRDFLQNLSTEDRTLEIERDRVSIRSLIWRMYDMNDYYVRHQTPKPVLGFILSKADHIKDLLATPHADESISTLYIILDAYFVDAYYRYSIHVDREIARRDELHQKALAELPEDAIIPEPGPSRTYQSILIDLSEQRLYAFEEGTLVLSTPVTTGRRGFSTIRGDFSVQKKQQNVVLKSPFENITYSLHVDYWIPFYGSYGIHDACNEKSCWRTEFGGSDYVSRGSHGCVNTPYDAIEWVYKWSLPGTRVRVQS